MQSVTLNYNGEYFNVVVDKETYEELLNDANKLATYSAEAYKLLYSDSDGTEVHDLPGSSSKANVNPNFKWTHDLTLLLIDQRLGREREFNRPICKKKRLWEQIAFEINKNTSMHITSDMCDIKYRNLLNTYKANKKKSQQSGEESISWEFFHRFDEILGCKASTLPQREVLGDVNTISMEISDSDTSITNCPELEFEERSEGCDVKATENVVEKQTKVGKKRKQSMTIGEYLFLKQREDKERKLGKEKREEELWQEKKALKEREISAIEQLANAISRQYTRSTKD